MKIIIILLNILFYLGSSTPINPDAIIGKWENPNGGRKIEIFKKDNLYFGKIISVNDKEAKVKPGDIVIKNIQFEKNKWIGKIKIPAKENDFDLEISMPNSNNLKFVASYGLISKTKIWKRIR